MEESKSKQKRCAEKPSLKATGPLAIPKEILAWERDLLAILLEAVEDSVQGRQKPDHEVKP